jgi:dTDP-3-amino-2,3,6-trideoxy-4-keto-D-glucose/dTDP-3-amino-3,4,6-trideoxy-alpha-D-glucose/dTDP-2,6-dideoxy-D-kanosamine transaminase
MKIKVWDYLKEYEAEKDEIHNAIEEVLTSGYLILGEKVKRFEEEFAAYCGVKYGIGVDNGTDALFLALKALEIGEGDEVITVSNTAVPTVSAITATGATAVFVDVDPVSYLIDTDKIEKVITQKTKCILPVHLFGQCADMKKINELASKYNLYVLEDCAQSHGAEFEGRKAGSMSDLAAFSFYPTKILGGFGDGGMVITGNQGIYEKMKRLRFYGMEKTYYSLEQGYNSRLDEMHASILLKKLGHIDEYIDRRRYLANRYNQYLSKTSLVLPTETENRKHAYYLYVVRHPQRELIMDELKKKEIFVNISYPWPIHTMEGFVSLGYKTGDLPVTEKLANEIFSLPMYPSLSDDEQKLVAETLMGILKQFSI